MKKNMTLSAMALLSALVIGGSAAATTVFAAEGDPTTDPADTTAATKSGATADTPATETGDAYVTFTKSTKPTGPINPNHPTDDPNNPGTGEVGDLTLDAIPNVLNFGTQEATSAEQTITLLAAGDTAAANNPASQNKPTTSVTDGDTHQIYTQVTDMAAAKPTWKLSATLNAFSGSLKDATINLSGAKSQALTGSGDTLAWTTTAAAGNEIPTVAGDITLTPGQAADIVASSKATGTTQAVWDTKNVTLHVPAGTAVAGDYTATIDWTLAIVAE
ncbi:WxL domain-containing protein [Lacticaseibacillus baoqingensis]|uniref:WxL domain-containing protein n=1 Tax=Lacticaseibacillus baoqingensis TaxID=2486013 RepID=A0ABW4EA54_9LACO|nr:WxL domain-containing protein [Lacticaseibacillus baoqingensis]